MIFSNSTSISSAFDNFMSRSVKGLLTAAIVLLGVPELAYCEKAKMEKEDLKVVTTETGLKYRDDKVGSGEKAVAGKPVKVHYTGWLDNNGKPGSKFDSSKDRGQPFEFDLGARMVIAGWDEGVAGMQVGGVRTLMIPSKLGYGPRGAGGVIPPNADLIFEVELLDVG